jgi:hypothetical protein
MEPTSGEYTRSKVLKRAAVGAAAVWSVPLFASAASASTRHAAAGNISACASGSPPGPDCNFTFQNCGHVNGLDCFCYAGARPVKNGVQRSSGCCVCGGNEFCSSSPPCAAHGNADCPSGWKCTFNGCGQTCVPPCGQGVALVAGAANAPNTASR